VSLAINLYDGTSLHGSVVVVVVVRVVVVVVVMVVVVIVVVGGWRGQVDSHIG